MPWSGYRCRCMFWAKVGALWSRWKLPEGSKRHFPPFAKSCCNVFRGCDGFNVPAGTTPALWVAVTLLAMVPKCSRVDFRTKCPDPALAEEAFVGHSVDNPTGWAVALLHGKRSIAPRPRVQTSQGAVWVVWQPLGPVPKSRLFSPGPTTEPGPEMNTFATNLVLGWSTALLHVQAP